MDGVQGGGSSVLTHPIQLQDGEVEFHKILNHISMDRGSTDMKDPGFMEAKSLPDLAQDQGISDGPSPWHWTSNENDIAYLLTTIWYPLPHRNERCSLFGDVGSSFKPFSSGPCTKFLFYASHTCS